jgi:hypothetical protein
MSKVNEILSSRFNGIMLVYGWEVTGYGQLPRPKLETKNAEVPVAGGGGVGKANTGFPKQQARRGKNRRIRPETP